MSAGDADAPLALDLDLEEHQRHRVEPDVVAQVQVADLVDVEPFGPLAEQAVLKAGFHQPFGNLALKIHRELPPVSATASWIRSRSKMNLIL